MIKMTKIQATLLVLIAAGIGMIAIQSFGQSTRKQQTVEHDGARTKGDPQARVKIVEFIDFQCPACAKGAKVLDEYFQDHSEEMFIQMKYFPLRMHDHAFLAARYAQCATTQKKFWLVHDLLIERQSQWKKLEDPRPEFNNIAREAGVDMRQFEQCLESPEAEQAIFEDIQEGQAKGVKSTPTYFVNGNMVVGYRPLKGALDYLFSHPSS